jgi:hypothetical protein
MDVEQIGDEVSRSGVSLDEYTTAGTRNRGRWYGSSARLRVGVHRETRNWLDTSEHTDEFTRPRARRA